MTHRAGTRTLGVAESHHGGETSVLAGAVVRADRVLDGLAYDRLTVGGMDATDCIAGLVTGMDRPDVRSLLLAGIAPAWFNLVDIAHLHERVDRPVVSVSFEASEGLDAALREAFDGDALTDRRAIYESLPERHAVPVNGETVFVRAVGLDIDAAAALVRTFTPEGGRPEPLRVARLAARAVGAFVPDP